MVAFITLPEFSSFSHFNCLTLVDLLSGLTKLGQQLENIRGFEFINDPSAGIMPFVWQPEFGSRIGDFQLIQAMLADTRDTLLLTTKHPLLRILCEQPAIWAVPLAIGVMIVVSRWTRATVPEDSRMKMLVLHAPEELGLKQEYIQEHQHH